MFLPWVHLFPQTGIGTLGLSTLLTGEIHLGHLVLHDHAAAVDVLGVFLHIRLLLVVVS